MKKIFQFLFVVCCLFTATNPLLAQSKTSAQAKIPNSPTGKALASKKTVLGLAKTTTNDVYAPMMINNVMNYYSSSGDGSLNPFSANNEGFEFPIGSGGNIFFEDGIVIGGSQNVNGTHKLKVQGSTYWHSFQAGKILTPGTNGTGMVADNPALAKYRIYRVRPDINPAVPEDSVMTQLYYELNLRSRYESGLTVDAIYNQYITDWNNWPAADGAPYIDVNHNGAYDPQIDIPGISGAACTMWHVMNDCDSIRDYTFAGSAPFGIEVQRTIWAYNVNGPLNNTIFVKYRIINKSGAEIDSTYIDQWSDPDLGYAGDDYVGCDTVRNLGYVYNGSSADPFYGVAVPAGGTLLVQGPRVAGQSSDSAIFGGGWVHGYKNIGMTGFNFFINGNPTYQDPTNNSYDGTIQWYNLLQGKTSLTGQKFTNPVTGLITPFLLSGDPVSHTGWTEDLTVAPGDQRMCLTTGPLTFAAGDTQEIAIAFVAGQGTDRLSSITQLKENCNTVQYLANGVFEVPVAGVASVASLYPTGATVALHGSILNPAGSSVTGQWVIVQKPLGSTASINVVSTGEATFIPDVAGTYEIGYQAKVGATVVNEADVQFQVTAVQQPVATFVVQTQGSVGDTVYVDGSNSTDPQGLPLKYQWTVSGGDVFDLETNYDSIRTTVINPTANKAMFVARRAASYTISLSVSDSVWTTTYRLSVLIAPIKSGSEAVSSITNEDLFPRAGFYGFGPFGTDNTGALWGDNGGTYFPINFANLVNPTQSYEIGVVGNFTVNSGTIYCTDGVYGVYIFTTDGNSGITGQYNVNPPGVAHTRSVDTLVTKVYISGHYLLFSSGVLGIYVYDITSPSAPVYTTKFTNDQYWGNFTVDGPTLVGVNPRTSTMTAVNISNPASPDQLTLFALPHPYSNVRKYGSYYFFFKSDTIGIYDLSNILAPTLKSEIAVTRTLSTRNAIYDIAGDGTNLMVTTSEGVYFYNVANPSVPVFSGEFLTGTQFQHAYIGEGNALAFNRDRGVAGPGSYEGLVNFSGVTSVKQGGPNGVATQYQLLQNYPNPFNPSTKISYQLPVSSFVTLKIYDIIGREISTLVNERENAGQYEVTFDGSRLASGVYFYRIQAGTFSATKKFVLMK